MSSLLQAITTITFAFFLGYVLLVGLWFLSPDLFNLVQDGANQIENWAENLPLGARLQGPIGFLIGDDQIMLVFMTITARIIISGVIMTFQAILRR